jgi:hypothetical protein
MITIDILIGLLCAITVLFYYSPLKLRRVLGLLLFGPFTFFYTINFWLFKRRRKTEELELEILKVKFRTGDAVFTSHPKFNPQRVYYLGQANKGGESYFLSSSKNLNEIEREVLPPVAVHVSYLSHEPFKCCPNCKQPFDTRLKP